MDVSTLISFATFAIVAAFTPGPNNIMLTASGAKFGFRQTLPHIFGILVGFCSLVVTAGFGLAKLFAMMPWLYDLSLREYLVYEIRKQDYPLKYTHIFD